MVARQQTYGSNGLIGDAIDRSGRQTTATTGEYPIEKAGERPTETNPDPGRRPDPAIPGPESTKPDRSGHPKNKDALVASLISSGYDPTKANELAIQLMATAGQPGSVSTPSVSPATAGSAAAGSMAAPTPIEKNTFQGLLDNGSGVAIGDTSVHTREVQDNELVNNQLNDLLSSDSKYIRDARLRGIEFANKRGQLGSSFSAGAAERNAIEAGLPIATADAQAYRDAAEQNLNALNNFSLANIQRATTLDVALLDSNTSISIANLDSAVRVGMANLDALTRTNIANLDAATQTSIANLSSQTQLAVQTMQSQLALTMQGKSFEHEAGLEQLKQYGRVELSMLDGALQKDLKRFEIDGYLDLSRLNHEEQKEIDAIMDGYAVKNADILNGYNRTAAHASAADSALQRYVDVMLANNDVNMDANAAARQTQMARDTYVAAIEMINGLYPEQTPIVPKWG